MPQSRPWVPLLFLLLGACRAKEQRATSPATADASADAGPVDAGLRVFVFDASIAADAAGTAAPDAGPEVDFEDLFEYGEVDAGAGDPEVIRHTKTYVPYANARFQFSLEIPATFTPMPAPENGDGMQWRVGRLAAVTASGIAAMDMPLSCARSKHVTARREGKSFCWATGKRDGYVFWEKIVRNGDVDYSLRFQYAATVKEAMDPIVKHVAASWNP